MVVDMGKMMNGHAMPMPLMNGDIIYVPTTAAGNWNETMSQILPSLQLISGILQPFVQMEYLDRQLKAWYHEVVFFKLLTSRTACLFG